MSRAAITGRFIDDFVVSIASVVLAVLKRDSYASVAATPRETASRIEPSQLWSYA